MLTIVYRIITVAAIAFVVIELASRKELKVKANAAIVLVPLILRALMIV
jgi:hypothetical protein